LRILVDGIFFQLAETGISRVWRSALPLLAARPDVEVLLLDRGGVPPMEGVRLLPFPSYQFRYTVAESALIQKMCDHYAIDVFSSTYYTTPLDTPSLMIVHDMIPELFDFDFTGRDISDKELTICHARKHLAVSKQTAADLLKFYPELISNPARIAHNGVDHEIFNPRSDTEVIDVRRKLGTTRPYFITVGERSQHKGYKNTKLFFRSLKELKDFDFDIVCVGGAPDLEDYIKELTPPEISVTRIQLGDDELAAAYTGAAALVYPSIYEGFGLPVAEAMACACPVITTRAGSLKEVAGDAARLVGVDNTRDMARALTDVRDETVRHRLITLGLKQAVGFRWDQFVDALEETARELTLEARAGAHKDFYLAWRKLREIQGEVDTLAPNPQVLRRSAADAGTALEPLGLRSAMRPAAAGRMVEHRIWSIAGTPGILAYGPYVRLSSGPYRLKLRFGTDGPIDEALALGLEVVSAEVLITADALRLQESEKNDYSATFDFTVPSELEVLNSEAEIEFRIFSNGGGPVCLKGLLLEGAPPARGAPAVTNLLPIITVAEPGANHYVGARITGSGHLVYGPYRRLLPGTYRLDVELAGVPAGALARIEVMSDTTEIAGLTFTAGDDEGSLSIPFEVRDATATFQFRLWFDQAVSAEVVRLQLLYDGPRKPDAKKAATVKRRRLPFFKEA
jgi:glycosyltransferase involved in cell wall biosynthesis